MNNKQQLLMLQQKLVETLPDDAVIDLGNSPSGTGFDITISFKRSKLVCEIKFENGRVNIGYLGDMIDLPAALAFDEQVDIIQRRLGLPKAK